jgi:ATP-dependent exoDNAse (exonuclease V) beta subunit
MRTTDPPDARERERACDVRASVIVQAPAGSGKTSLLTERFLALLAVVDAPEEIVAITFTRKAAAEMKMRVLGALAAVERDAAEEHPRDARMAQRPGKAGSDHAPRLRERARAALARSREKGWDLPAHPARLNIRTIDSFCAALARQMPLAARFGEMPVLLDDAHELYREAARATLAEMESGQPWSAAIATLAAHLDNNLARAEALLAEMLACRDHWLRHVTRGADSGAVRAELEATIAHAVREELEALRAAAPAALAPEIIALGRYAAGNLGGAVATMPPGVWEQLNDLPGADGDDLDAWRGFAELLLRDNGALQKTVDVRHGFPKGKAGTPADARKQAMLALLAALDGHEEFIARLHAARALPAPRYDERQWEVLAALTTLLPVAVAQLRLIFAARGCADHAEVAQAALRALGTDAEPTDLLLALDYRIRHVLVDEFQDVSLTQNELFRRLTAGWTPGDGRTFFAVGDPMQSIYRFREAEVGVFLRAQERGIGGVTLTPLWLNANFRSQRGIVEWVNNAFGAIFPARGDVETGAVAYAPAHAIEPAAPGVAVTVHPFFDADRIAEAQRVVEIVNEARATHGDARIAILVRSRGHLSEIAPQLRAAGLRFRAIEIEQLGERPVVQDLVALTRALLHPADRIAWLAVLRAPWCGLTLADLHALCADDHATPVSVLMREATRIVRLSPDGCERLARTHAVLDRAEALRLRASLRRTVEGAWLALGGPASLMDRTALEDAHAFFELLDELEAGEDGVSPARLAERVAELSAAPDASADDRLELLTIHKAKGLQFDVVILPGLGRKPRRDETRLLVWSERPTGAGDELFLAPIAPARGRADDNQAGALYRFVAALERRRTDNETLRLLYVAATRAISRLHLLGHAAVEEDDGHLTVNDPDKGSLLWRLWPVVRGEFEAAARAVQRPPAEPPAAPVADDEKPTGHRLPRDWLAPAPPPCVAWNGGMARRTTDQQDAIEFLWAGPTARHVGTLVHRYLMRITAEGLDRWDAARIAQQRPHLRAALLTLGVPRAELDEAAARVSDALRATLDDPRGRWLLGPRDEGHAEYAVTGVAGGRIVNAVMDRTFVDGDARWIVDYKTGTHAGGDADAFLDQERERYRGQLETYAALMRALDSRPIRLGLYFPLLHGWREL